ncbi:MAG: hypothetical protein U0746_19785 [Gemmataceae bacterium]
MTIVVRISLAALVLAVLPAPAQDIGYQYTRLAVVRIPFTANPNLRRVELFVSTDDGRDWKQVADADPTGTQFSYTFPADGRYWFAVRSLDNLNRYFPASLQELRPQRKIVYDTAPPVALLRSAPDTRPNTVTCEWEVRDENLDLGRFAIEWRIPGVSDWARDERATPAPTGALSWTLKPGVRMDVRIRAADKAGNEAVQQTGLGIGADGRALAPAPGEGASGSPGIHYSSQLKLSFKFAIAKMPPSGIPVFDLWYTQDKGATWKKAPKNENSAAPGTLPATPGQPNDAREGRLAFDATEQGLYGFLIVARNGVGIGDQDPKPGDTTNKWVEIDTEAPKIELRAQAGQGYDVRNVTIQWKATDKNLADKPVKLLYAEKKGDAEPAESDWKPIPGLGASFDAAGVQTWTVGREGPHRFLVRATAVDKAGNIGRDQSKEPLIVDLEHPSVSITLIEPAGKDK